MGNCPSASPPECDTQEKIGFVFDESVSVQTTEIIGIINEIFQNFQYSLCKDEKMEKWKNIMKEEATKANASLTCEQMKEDIKKELNKPPFTTDKVTAKLLEKLSDKIFEIYCKDKKLDFNKLLNDIFKTICSDSLTGEKLNIIKYYTENQIIKRDEGEEIEEDEGEVEDEEIEEDEVTNEQYRIRGSKNNNYKPRNWILLIILLIVIILLVNPRNLRNKINFFSF